ncbi:MAG: Crp/Fnr family transcriptional regulator [Pseudomonadota bacterium]
MNDTSGSSSSTPSDEQTKKQAAFAACDLFTDLTPDELASLARHARLQNYSRGAIIMGSGEQTDSIYLLTSGRVRAFRDSEEGRQITLNIINPGEIFGELAAISNEPRVATIETLEECTTLVITPQYFVDLISSNPQVALTLIRIMVERVQAMSIDLSDIALLEMYGRVARVLVKKAEQIDGGWAIENITHQDIANLTGSSRETVSRIIKMLRQKELIETEGRQIRLSEELMETM